MKLGEEVTHQPASCMKVLSLFEQLCLQGKMFYTSEVDISRSHHVLISRSPHEEVASLQATRCPNGQNRSALSHGYFWVELRTFPAATVDILSWTVSWCKTSKPRGSRTSRQRCDKRRGRKFKPARDDTLSLNSSVVCGLSHDFLLHCRNNHHGH